MTLYIPRILVTMTKRSRGLVGAFLALVAGVALIGAGLVAQHPTITRHPNRNLHSAVYYPSTRPPRNT